MSTTTIERVDPKTLLIGPNVRKETTLRKEFVSSVQLHGVLVPIIAHQTPDGLEVLDGQMRTLAAVDAGLAEVPVFVQPEISDDASRIVEQIVVNEDRQGLTITDHVGAIRQLALDFKMPVAQIVKRTGATKDQVAAVVSIAKSPAAGAALALGEEGMTLELAAKIADADLTPDEIARVLGNRYNRDHAIQQVLDDRERARRVAELEQEVSAAGITLAEKPTAGNYVEPGRERNKHMFLDQLVDKVTGKKITGKAHASCPGHAVFVGVRGYRGVVESHDMCTDPTKHGHRDVNKAAPKPPLTDEERAQKQVDAANTAEWPSITTVRAEWIRDELLTRKAVPAGWEYLAVADVTNEYPMTWGFWQERACDLLQLSVPDSGYNRHSDALRVYARKTNVNAAKTALAAFIARHEHAVAEKNAKGWSAISPVYLGLLDAWGYGLSELERKIVDAAAAKA